ncbi:MAG: glycine/betaine/sarcosine/D-proline family reductase selenoprotein B [Deltaproteobacteria bacterium]|nr:glycine/betaine/sarcosine/D-proline family reductase selenoprotein B [Deltaproteobacteria bacterium]
MSKTRVMHYLNQFFAGVGAEEKAGVPVGSLAGAIGPGKPLQELLGDSADIVVTAYCGDDYFANHVDEAVAAISRIAQSHKIELVVAGPAFGSGRYGFACAEVCHGLSSALDISSVAAMHPENPGIETYRQYKDRNVYVFPTTDVASGMREALSQMALFGRKLALNSPVGKPYQEGYIPRGFRLDEFSDQTGAARAVRMLLDKISGRPFISEIPVEHIEAIPVSPPLKDLQEACLGLITTSGIIPSGNPDGFRGFQNIHWAKYSIEKVDSMSEADWDVVHGGYNTDFMKRNPNYGVPLDVCRQLERERIFGRLDSCFYATPGARGLLSVMHGLGKEMADDMKQRGVDGALLVST